MTKNYTNIETIKEDKTMIKLNIEFCGFYGSWHDATIDSLIDSDIDFRCDELNQKHASNEDYDYPAIYLAYSKQWLICFEQFIEWTLDINVSFKFVKLFSPREYNFETDTIYADVSKEEAFEINEAIMLDEYYREKFKAYVRRKTTPSDGYAPYFRYSEVMFDDELMAKFAVSFLTVLAYKDLSEGGNSFDSLREIELTLLED